jgi:hypothetical protein
MTSQFVTTHIPDETLEQYCMGHLSESETEPIEEHLLICNRCQDALTETEEFLIVVRSAARESQAHPQPEAWWKRGWQELTTARKPLFALAACAGAMLIFIPMRTPKPAVVELQTLRGPESASQAPANRSLSLRLSIPGGNAREPLEVQVAGMDGKVVAQLPVEQMAGQTVAKMPGLAPGNYWVRLYSQSQIIREYALHVQ